MFMKMQISWVSVRIRFLWPVIQLAAIWRSTVQPETMKMVVYNGLGHAYFDNCGVYPQCEDLIAEMGEFINSHAK